MSVILCAVCDVVLRSETGGTIATGDVAGTRFITHCILSGGIGNGDEASVSTDVAGGGVEVRGRARFFFSSGMTSVTFWNVGLKKSNTSCEFTATFKCTGCTVFARLSSAVEAALLRRSSIRHSRALPTRDGVAEPILPTSVSC